MNTFRLIFFGMAFTFSVLPVLGIARPALMFIKPTDLPDLGLRLKLMPESREAPPASPPVFLCQFTRGDQTWKEERFSPLDLWKQGQYAGQWVGRDGSKLLLAVMSQLPPSGSPAQPVTRALYEQQTSLATNSTLFSSESDIARWVSCFSDYPHPVGKRVDKQASKISPVYVFRLDNLSPNRVAYVFRLAAGAGKSFRYIWICAQFDLNTDILMESACDIIEKDFLGSISATTQSRPAPAREALTKAGEEAADASADLKVAQQQVINSIRNLKGWWYDVTPNYIILSNLKSGSDSFVEQLKISLKLIRSAYRQCIPESLNAGIGVIRIPATRQEYCEYVGEDSRWTSGLWVPRRKELVLCPADNQSVRGKRQSLLHTAFHEGFHQYAYYAFGQANPSMWFNEGYAQFFENAVVANGRISIEESPRALALVTSTRSGSEMDLRRLLSLSWQEFYDSDDKIRTRNYAFSWAFVYYLKKDASSPFTELLDRYVAAFQSNGGNGEKATESMLAGVDLKRLQLDFERFWQSNSRQAAARRYNPFDSRQ